MFLYDRNVVDNRGWNIGPAATKRWVIEKETKLICFGYPGYVKQWKFWESYDTREEAEDALKKLYLRRDPTSLERYQITDAGKSHWFMK